jgi:hypothetical protein
MKNWENVRAIKDDAILVIVPIGESAVDYMGVFSFEPVRMIEPFRLSSSRIRLPLS